MVTQQYENLDEEAAEEESSGVEGNRGDQSASMAAMANCICCCCCCSFMFLFFWIGASIFSAPEPRDGVGAQIWDPVLPANFTSLTDGYEWLWVKNDVSTLSTTPTMVGESIPTMVGEWREGWHFFTWYFYYVVPAPTGEVTMIHGQSFWKFFGWGFRIWRGDTTDGIVLTLSQDYWAQPWFSFDKVRIFDVYQDNLPIARLTQTTAWTWIGYGGSTVDLMRVNSNEVAPALVQSAPLVHMTQPPVFWFFQFVPPIWQVTNFAPNDVPSAVPGFYALVSDCFEWNESLGPFVWILIILVIVSDASKIGKS